MSATITPAAPSVILAMHARYEAAWSEYNRIDAAKTAARNDPDSSRSFSYARGLCDNNLETDLLRHAVLFQVPSSDEELAVLAFHAWGVFDHDQSTEEDNLALEQALVSIFDYLVGEGRGGIKKLGPQFNAGAQIVFHRRRYRTGLIEVAA